MTDPIVPSPLCYTNEPAAGSTVTSSALPRSHPKGSIARGCGVKRVKPSDREDIWTHLMDQSLRGDARAYERLLRLLTVALRNAVRGRARAAGLDADDVVQEVLLALHLKRSTWTQGAPVGAWVAAIARNKIVDALRRRGRRVAVPIDEVLETLGVETRAREEHVHDLDTALG